MGLKHLPLVTIDAPTFADPVDSFEFLNCNFQSKVLKNFYSSPPFLGRRMKPSRCSMGGFSSLKRILRASQT
jgi:hypothetical protein